MEEKETLKKVSDKIGWRKRLKVFRNFGKYKKVYKHLCPKCKRLVFDEGRKGNPVSPEDWCRQCQKNIKEMKG